MNETQEADIRFENAVRSRVGRYVAALEQSRKFTSHADPCFQRSGKPCSCGYDAWASKVGQLLAEPTGGEK